MIRFHFRGILVPLRPHRHAYEINTWPWLESMRCVLIDPSVEECAWSPDGRRIAFHSRRDGRWGIYVYSGN